MTTYDKLIAAKMIFFPAVKHLVIVAAAQFERRASKYNVHEAEQHLVWGNWLDIQGALGESDQSYFKGFKKIKYPGAQV